MSIESVLEYLRHHTRGLKKAFFLLLSALIVIDIMLPREHSHYFLDRISAYWTMFSVAGCFLLIKFSKGVAHLFLSRDENYYG